MKKHEVIRLDIRRDYPAPPLESVTIPDGVWRNGLLVRMPNHLGDAVMALPALTMLRKRIPEHCSLQILAPEYQRPLYERLSMVDGFTGLRKLHRRWSGEEFMAVRRLRCGVGVFFTNSLRDALLLRLAGVGRLYGAAARGRGALLTHAFCFAPRRRGQPSGEHQANRCMALARALGAPEWDGRLPEFQFKIAPEELRPELAALIAHPRLLCLGAGAAYGAAKRWPAAGFREVARFWIEHGGIAAVAGGGAERQVGDEVIAGLDQRKAFNLCGRTGLTELMHLLRCSRLIVANDSGIMHLGAALGRPGVAVFGPTDLTATGPVSDSWWLIRGTADCAPCFRRECPGGSAGCIAGIGPGEVIGAVREICARYAVNLQ